MTATRRQAREWAVQMLSAADLNPPADTASFIAQFWDQLQSYDVDNGGNGEDAPKKLRVFAEARLTGVLATLGDIDAKLKAHLKDWDVARLGTVERAVLRMGIWEMDNCPDIPKPVVINEAVDLVNWFSNPKSRTLVNGVLDAYAKGR